jgi:hypothetical protein
MGQTKATDDLSKVLRQTIIKSKTPLLVLERETAVPRASVRRFLAGKQSLRLDAAGKLAKYLGLELVKRKET